MTWFAASLCIVLLATAVEVRGGPVLGLKYTWGYAYPGQSHFESKTFDGTVSGKYEFLDPNGVIQKTSYSAGPSVGYTANLESSVPSQQVFVASGAVPGFKIGDVPNVPQFTGLDIGTQRAIEKASPQLLAAVRSGYLTPIPGDSHQLLFQVSNNLVNEAQGSVSKLASLLDTDVVAARHDQQTYRQNPGASVYSAQEDNARAILEQTSSLGVPSYVVRIPYY